MVNQEFPQDKTTVRQLLNEYFGWESTLFTIHDTGVVDAHGSILLSKETSRLPVRFGVVGGNFLCHRNKLETLEGCPHTVLETFDCSENQLISLVGGPKTVKGQYSCQNNKLSDLLGSPQDFTQEYIACNNNLVSLRGAPLQIGGMFDVSNNLLTDLQDAPQTVEYFWATNNKLTTLKGASLNISKQFIFDNNPLENLEGLGPQTPDLIEVSYKSDLPLLRLLVAQKVNFWPVLWGKYIQVETILKKYAGQGKRALFYCQKELEDAGFERNAKW